MICPKCAATTRPGTVDGRRYESVCMACGPVSAATYATRSGCEAEKASSSLPGRRGQIPLPAGNKYGAEKCEVDGIVFDSKREAKRWRELWLMESAGEIKNLARQVRYELVVNDVKVSRYTADFVYERDGQVVVEDAKGFHARDWPMRKKLMLAVHNIDVQEV